MRIEEMPITPLLSRDLQTNEIMFTIRCKVITFIRL